MLLSLYFLFFCSLALLPSCAAESPVHPSEDLENNARLNLQSGYVRPGDARRACKVQDVVHRSLLQFSPAHLHPDRRDPNEPLRGVRQVLPGVYAFNLFTEQFCTALIEESERCGKWHLLLEEHAGNVEAHVGVAGIDTMEKDDDVTLALDEIPGLDKTYYTAVQRAIRPILGQLWPSFRLRVIDDPYLVRYSLDLLPGMSVHHDAEDISIIIYLNSAFKGGGTFFPRWNKNTQDLGVQPGMALVYPGGIGHVHRGAEILEGRRYLLIGAFYG
jgi:hypothetical protein